MDERMNTDPSRRAWLAGLAATIALGAGCIATPVPEPPNLSPPEIQDFEVDVSRQVGTILITGAPGTVPPQTGIWGVDLETVDPPATAVAAADGSFALGMTASEGDVLRLQYRNDTSRSDPVDALVTGAGSLEPAVGAVAQACIALEPALELDLGPVDVDGVVTGAIAVVNRCDEAASVGAARMRVETGPFELVTAAPLDVAAGGEADVEVRFAPTTAGDHEEILLLEVGTTLFERRPVTLFGEGVAP
jgi:hypothetical protein